MPSNSWEVGTMYYGGRLNGTIFFSQSAPFQPVTPAITQGEPWTDFPGAGSMVFSYGPWIMPGCGHPIHEFNVIQEYDYTTNQPVALLTCACCSYIQRAVPNSSDTELYGPTAVYDPNLYCVIVA
jgi:hypothetical protein